MGRALRRAGIVLLASATNLVEADAAEAVGVDAMIAQGWEAGGHRGIFDPDAPDPRYRLQDLIAALVQKAKVPIIAAGGIMDGADIAAALRNGAAAAQLGTAFVAADESLADAQYRSALAASVPGGTMMVRTLSGRPARSLPSRFTALTARIPDKDIPAYPLAYDLAKALHAATCARGERGFGAKWAGERAHAARRITDLAGLQRCMISTA